MNNCLIHSFRPTTIRLSLVVLIALLSYSPAYAQIIDAGPAHGKPSHAPWQRPGLDHWRAVREQYRRTL
jgi:hypothetical protein